MPVKCIGLKFMRAGHNDVILLEVCLSLNCSREKRLIFYVTLSGSVVVISVTRSNI